MRDSSSGQGLPPAYQPTDYEQKIYRHWLGQDYFRAQVDSDKEPYCISMPPPNITGVLHLGHVMGNAIQDTLIRFERMRGKEVLYLPGTDHAAIATNVVVEQLLAQEGKTRHDVGREVFLQRVRDFVDVTKERIHEQERRIGISVDWSRERYTMDKHMSRAVNEAFVRLYNDGLIYRGHRIVNWDPKLQTTVSDEEVDYKKETAPLYTLQYGPFKISTARPETKFGDKYVVMHPDDKRYAEYKHGQTIRAEWINGPVSATVIKDKVIDPEFGTGVMTITPWHDATDFEIAERHALDKEQIIDKEGKLLKIAGEFGGMLIDQARPAIVQKLKAKGLLVSVDEGYSHNVAINSRGGAMIEPQILEQWFIKVAPLAKKALAAVRSGEIKIIPANFEKIYFHWMENIHDWNISRQIWWGHSIPVFTCAACRHEFVSVEVADTCPKCQSAVTQDPDTLDTWFSSGLWTFATLGWPDKTPDLERWHPTTLMETGRDIIFFWVARMIMFSLYFMDEVPFKTVYLHGLVLDKDGKKMSKSKGNGIEPLEMADKYGTDALRLSLNTGVSAGLDTRLGEDKIAHQRNFVNKLWNVSRFVIKTTKCERTCERLSQIKLDDLELEDQWILDRLGLLTEATTRALEEYRFSDAIVGLQDFVWNDFADWYLEIAKRKPGPAKNDVLLGVLEHVLALLHPVAPFVTEVIWQELKKSDPEAARRPDLIVSAWPATNKQLHNAKSRKDFEELQTLVKTLRAIRADYHITFATKLAISVSPSKSLQLQAPLVEQLTNTTITFGKTGQGLKRTAGSGVVHADLQGLVDVKSEKERLAKELAKLTGVYAALTKRLASKTFIDKAPAAIVAKERERERELSKKIQELERLVQELGQIR